MSQPALSPERAAAHEANLRRRIRAHIGRYMLSGSEIQDATREAAKDFKYDALAKGWEPGQAGNLAAVGTQVGAEWTADLIMQAAAQNASRGAGA